MPIAINGSGTVTGISVGGLPDGIVDTDMIATEAVTNVKQGPGSIVQFIQGTPNNINNRSSTNTASSWSSSGNYVKITPTNSTNKIIVGGHFTSYVDNAARGLLYTVYNSHLSALDADQESGAYYDEQNDWHNIPIKYECTAGTTNEITFTLYMKRYGGTDTSYGYCGWSSSAGTDNKNHHDMWAMEVVA
jgi:hypothetical protein